MTKIYIFIHGTVYIIAESTSLREVMTCIPLSARLFSITKVPSRQHLGDIIDFFDNLNNQKP